MPVKTYRPTTSARRGASGILFRKLLTKKKPEKTLTKGRKRLSGRGREGKLTVRHRGGGAKKKYRFIDFRQQKLGIPGTVRAIEYDPNRTAFLALVVFADGEKSYILAPRDLRVGDKIIYNESAKARVGNRMRLRNIPPGMPIHNIELMPDQGGKIVRSAGSSASIMSFDRGLALIRMPSSELRLIPERAFASIGVVSNPDHSNIVIGKAGRSRWAGRRPVVRGKAMNPADHPHGGGEGGSPIGLKHPKTKWGKPAFGVKTRRDGASDKFIVRRRVKRKKRK